MITYNGNGGMDPLAVGINRRLSTLPTNREVEVGVGELQYNKKNNLRPLVRRKIVFLEFSFSFKPKSGERCT